jgi:uncharacterized lipoprotein YmbA
MASRKVRAPLVGPGLWLVALVAAAGCASAPARFYTLTSTATALAGPRADYAVLVGPVAVPASVDRPELVLQASPNRVVLEEFNRWAGPLNESIARTVAGDLAALLGTPRVASGPLGNFSPAYRVTLDVQRFDSMPGDSVLVEAVWVVHETEGGKTQTGQTAAREPVAGEGFDALVAAHSRALAQMSAQIAAAIRRLAAAPAR